MPEPLTGIFANLFGYFFDFGEFIFGICCGSSMTLVILIVALSIRLKGSIETAEPFREASSE